MSKKKKYKHPIYGDKFAPTKCKQSITLPSKWKRGAIRRFELSCKKAGFFDYRIGHEVGLAFESKEERDNQMNFFEKQLELNNTEFKTS